ncbi:MAG: metal ABC transporter ATP-binding protein [Firmicutes bacterium]|nr:metal ABC transporter ATP-binding protein [Bacillota bacterium]
MKPKHSGNLNNACNLCCTKIEGFNVTLGNTEILKDINLHIHCGDLTAIIGPNGAGKSTLLKAVLGEIKHTGRLNFLNAEEKQTHFPIIGYVPQNMQFDTSSPISVMDFFMAAQSNTPVWLGHAKDGRAKTLEALSRVQAEHLARRRLGALSGGEMQRVLLALALEPVPDLLLLDEPISGIDQRGMEIFYGLVSQLRKEYDLSIILVSHDLGLVQKYADRVVLLNKVIVCAGAPREVFTNPKMAEIFGDYWTT